MSAEKKWSEHQGWKVGKSRHQGVCVGAGYVCIIIIKTRSKQAECRERLEAYLTEPGDPWHCNTGSALPGYTVRSLWFVIAPAHNLSTPPTKM